MEILSDTKPSDLFCAGFKTEMAMPLSSKVGIALSVNLSRFQTLSQLPNLPTDESESVPTATTI